MTESQVQERKHTYELTDDEIEGFTADQARSWGNRVMMRFWQIFRDDQAKYETWSEKLVRLGRTLEGWKTFLKEAVQELKQLLPHLQMV